MSKLKVVLNREGVRDFLRSDDVMAICVDRAQEIIDNYGDEAELSQYVGKNRVNVSIIAPRDSALENNDLLKAVGKND